MFRLTGGRLDGWQVVGGETIPLVGEAEGNLAGLAHPPGAMDIIFLGATLAGLASCYKDGQVWLGAIIPLVVSGGNGPDPLSWYG